MRNFNEFYEVNLLLNNYPFNITIFIGKVGQVSMLDVRKGNQTGKPSVRKSTRLILNLVVCFLLLFGSYKFYEYATSTKIKPYNPYTEDFNGDGIGGTKEDHEIFQLNKHLYK